MRGFFRFLLLLFWAWGQSGLSANSLQAEKETLEKLEQAFSAGQLEKLGQDCDASLSKYPNSLALALFCGKVWLMSPGSDLPDRRQKARQQLGRVISALSPVAGLNQPGRALLAESYFWDALAAGLGSSYVEAISLQKKALALEPDLPESWYNLAVWYEEAGETVAARQAFARYQQKQANTAK